MESNSSSNVMISKIAFVLFVIGLAIMAPAISYLIGVLVWAGAVDMYNEWLAGEYTVLAVKTLITGATIAIAAGVIGGASDEAA